MDGRDCLYWGKFSRGQYVNVVLNTEELPDDVPTVKYWLEGSTNVASEQIPYIKSPNKTFFTRLFLSDNFLDGSYVAVMQYELSSVQYVSLGYFQVQGGIGTSPIIAMMEIDRALGRAVVTQDDSGQALIGYRPKRLLP